MKLGVAVGEYRRAIAAVQTCVNMFPERAEHRARGEVTLRPTPGLTPLITGLPGGYGSVFTFQDDLYVVSGGTLYAVDDAGNETSIGSFDPTRPISIAANRTQMMILVGGTVVFDAQYFLISGANVLSGYIYDGTTLTQIVDGDFPTGDLGESVYYSNLADGSAWTALDFFSAESNPDSLRTHIVSHGNLLLFGTKQLEYWTPSDDADLPFQKSQGAEQERGCLSTQSVTGLDNTIFFLGDDRVVYKVLDFRPVRVSDHGTEVALEQESLANLTSARAFAYTQSGHYFYCLTVGDTTYVYDATISAQMGTSVWHRRTSDNGPWRVQWYGEAYGNKYGLDENGSLWLIDSEVYTENDAAVPWEFTIGPFAKDDENVACSRVTLLCQTGSTTDLDADPQVEMDISKDLGRTWYTKGTRSLGETGAYTRTVTWRRNGDAPASTGFTFKFHGERDYDFSVIDVIAQLK